MKMVRRFHAGQTREGGEQPTTEVAGWTGVEYANEILFIRWANVTTRKSGEIGKEEG